MTTKKPSERSVFQYFLSQNGFRAALLVLVLSQHPLGRQLLGTFGFEFPDQRKLTIAAEKVTTTESQISQIAENFKDLKADVSSLKANNAIINAKVDNLEQTFHGFQIDFNKWKTPEIN